METGIVFNVQKCSIHDGPGIRTLVFFKGCPLKCLWCANPESQDTLPEVASSYIKCIGCGACFTVCPQGCITPEGGRYIIDYDLCDHCGQCADVCYAESKQMMGREMTSDEVVDIIRKDIAYYRRSGGGVTFSGGEPLSRPGFLQECARKCKELGISVAVETCGYGNYSAFKAALDYIDLVLYDLKHADEQAHLRLTGMSNRTVFENLENINRHGVDIHVRIPVIPGCNDDMENLKALAEIVCGLEHVKEVELLAYHALGVNKYEMLGRVYEMGGTKPPSTETMSAYADELNKILILAGKICRYDNNLYTTNARVENPKPITHC